MNNYQYDKPLREHYVYPAAALTSAAVVGRFIGPAGKVGRVVNVSHIVTTDTDAAAVVTVDTNAGLASPVVHTVPNAPGQYTGGAIARDDATLLAQTELPADTVVEVQADGGPTATGEADLHVTVEWY
jgi:hypothetical protein